MNTTTTRTPAIDVTTNVVTMTMQLVFGNGETISLSTDELPNDIRHHAMLHGLKQKLVDAAAISRNPDTGRTASIDDKYAAVKEVYDRLLAGQWNKARGDGTGTKGGLLFRALCIMYANKSPDAIKAFLDKKTPAEKTALRNTARIASIIATFKQDDDSDVDADALLDELN